MTHSDAATLHNKFPAISDLKSRASRRIPKFVWEYLDSATGTEATLQHNRVALDAVKFEPSILHGELTTDLTCQIMGQSYNLPFGIAPVGMSGLMWPGAEVTLAQSATTARIPYSLSTVATRTPEDIAPHIQGNGWFQFYAPRDEDIRRDMLTRARLSGFDTLVMTVDVPMASRRERQVRSGLTNPPKLTPRLMAQVAMCPSWSIGMAQLDGKLPRMATLDKYSEGKEALSSVAHIGYLIRTSPDWEYLRWIREYWDGKLVIKGVLRAEDATKLEAEGVDAIWVSNHAGRQFDAAPASIEALPKIRAATNLPLIFDSGVEGGLDILRAIALGADYVMLGRAFHYALGALGNDGPAHLISILTQDMTANMAQLGVTTPFELRGKAL